MQLCVYSEAKLISTNGYMRWLVKTVSTRCSEIGFCYNEKAQVDDFSMLRFVVPASLPLAIGMQFSYNEMCIRCSEWSLPCDNVIYDVYVNCCVDMLMFAW